MQVQTVAIILAGLVIRDERFNYSNQIYAASKIISSNYVRDFLAISPRLPRTY